MKFSLNTFVASEADWDERIIQPKNEYKFGECNHEKKFFRAEHFQQHLKQSHAGSTGIWAIILTDTCRRDEPLPKPIRKASPVVVEEAVEQATTDLGHVSPSLADEDSFLSIHNEKDIRRVSTSTTDLQGSRFTLTHSDLRFRSGENSAKSAPPGSEARRPSRRTQQRRFRISLGLTGL